ncbi:MAG TPA: hypothetical protein VHS59_02060 [Bacillota bacterium]|nr:hypothetical protein [Bacillota bacterium]
MSSYETARTLASQSYQHWISKEFLTYQWWFGAVLLFVSYAVWLLLVDKRRITQILLFGSLVTALAGALEIILASFFGFWEYKIAILPIEPPLFIITYTVAPIWKMLVLQYTSSWKGYHIWLGIVVGVLAFGILPIYSALGMFQMYKGWTYFHHFGMMFTNAAVCRAIVVWLIGLEQRQEQDRFEHTRSSLVLQPALKHVNSRYDPNLVSQPAMKTPNKTKRR